MIYYVMADDVLAQLNNKLSAKEIWESLRTINVRVEHHEGEVPNA